MLGIDLYKEVLLNGEKYKGKKYKNKDGVIYTVDEIGKQYHIFEQNSSIGVINLNAHKNGAAGIHEFMLSELEEFKQEVEMPWQECLVKYIENSEKYYMMSINSTGKVSLYKNVIYLGYDIDGVQLTMDKIKNSKWFLCER